MPSDNQVDSSEESEVPDERLWALLGPRWRAVAALASTSFIGGVIEAAFLVTVTRAAFAVSDGDDRVEVMFGNSFPLGWTIVVALVLVVLRVSATVATTWQSARLSASVTASIRSDLGTAFLRASWGAQHGQRTGRLQELLTTFAQQGGALVTSASNGVTSGFSLAALLGAAMLVDPVPALVVVGAVGLLALALRPLRAAIRRQASSTSSTGMQFATSLGEISQIGLEMHVFGVQQQTETKVRSLIGDHEGTQRRLRFLQGLVPALYMGLAYVAVVGALGVIAALSVDDFTSVGAVMLIMLRSLSYGQAVQRSSAAIHGSLPFLGTLNRELDSYREARFSEGTEDLDAVGAIEVSGVSFEYTPDVPVLKDLDLRIDPSEVIGIVGPSGSGKSTLVQLLLGLRPPTSGHVLAGGLAIADIKRSQWSRKVTFVPQQAHLIAGTVSENIRFLRDEVSQQVIERAAKLAHLHEDIMGWDDGYDRQVGERGGRLSGGQQQRLIIARALVESPELLILDEPTSALDVRSESLIRETLDDLRETTTIIIIAHRLSTLGSCDRVMVIQDGELKAFDTPERLEQSSAFYREALVLSGMR